MDLGLPSVQLPFDVNSNGTAAVQIRIPNSAALHGLLLTAQAGADSSTQAPIGVDMTNGLLLAVRR